MSVVSALTVLLKGDGTHFSTTMRNARTQAQSFTSSMRSISGAASVVKTGMYAVATGGVAAYVLKTAEGIEASENFAHQLEITQQRLQQLRHAAITNGSSADTMDAALRKMNETLGEAQQGGAAAVKAFEQIGLSVESLGEMNAADQFRAIAQAVSEIESPAMRAAAIRDIFGRGASEMGRLMQEGARGLDEAARDANKYGVALNAVDTASIMRANDAIDNMKQAWAGLANIVTATVAPAIEKIADLLTTVAETTRSTFDYIGEKLSAYAAKRGVFGAFSMLSKGDPPAASGAAGATPPRQPKPSDGVGYNWVPTGLQDIPKMFTQADYQQVARQRLAMNGGAQKHADPQKEGNAIAKQQLSVLQRVERALTRPVVVKEASVV